MFSVIPSRLSPRNERAESGSAGDAGDDVLPSCVHRRAHPRHPGAAGTCPSSPASPAQDCPGSAFREASAEIRRPRRGSDLRGGCCSCDRPRTAPRVRSGLRPGERDGEPGRGLPRGGAGAVGIRGAGARRTRPGPRGRPGRGQAMAAATGARRRARRPWARGRAGRGGHGRGNRPRGRRRRTRRQCSRTGGSERWSGAWETACGRPSTPQV